MKQLKIQFFFMCIISVCSLNIAAQQTNTLYFLENSTLRHKLNPAFQPESDFYLSLPIMGYTGFNVGNNSLSLKDIVYEENGNTVTFLNQPSSIDRFYNKLKINTVLRTNLQTNLIGFGFHYESSYLTFSFTEKLDGTLSVPKDVFQLSLYGTPDLINNSFNFTTLQTDFTAYTEAAFGYAKDITEEWSIGGKFKILFGQANLSNTNSNFTFDAGFSNWIFKGEGSVDYSSPVLLNFDSNSQAFTYTYPTSRLDWLKPSGLGVGIDFGVEYHLNENINLSAALLDFGFISWNKNTINLRYGVDYTFDGIAQLNSNSTLSSYNDVYDQLIYGNLLIDSIVNAFEGSSTSSQTNEAYSTGTTAKLNLGFEYNLFNHFVGLGILSHTQFYDKTITEEITSSVNLRPTDWLNAALSYSLFNGTLSTFGIGLGLKVGIVNCFATADYVPFQKVTFPLTDISPELPNWNIPVPYNSRVFNFSVGLNFIFDYSTNGQKYRKANVIEKNKGLKTSYKPRVSDLEKKYLKSGNKHFLNSKKGLQPTKTNNDCRCETN